MKAFNVKAQIARLEKERYVLEQARDRLREMMDDVEGLHDIASDAEEQLNYAIERLSELV